MTKEQADTDTGNRAAQPWRNRIVGYRDTPTDDFLANEANWRIHPRPQRVALSETLKAVGIVQNVIVNLRTSPEWGESQNVETMLDGHLRVAIALSEGQPELPTTLVNLNPDEERVILS